MVSGLQGLMGSSLSSPVASELSSKTASGLGGTSKTGAMEFGKIIKDAIGEVDQLQNQAHAAVDGLMRGTGVDVHQTMIAAEKANMAFDLALAVRNKAVQSYQSVMSMQF
jgi:flagellar hook-basal body complex protein FliE